MTESETRRFLVTTPGLCATRWLSFVLASRSDVFVAHGKHSLESIVHGRFDTERQSGDRLSLALGNVMSEFYRCRPLDEVFDIYREIMPGALAYGNVHTYTLNEVFNRFGPVGADQRGQLAGVRVANVIRHPVAYIASHTAMVQSAADYPRLRDHYRTMFTEALACRPELLDVPCRGGEAIEAFVVSCLSASRFLEDFRRDQAPHFRMEDLTSDLDRLKAFCEHLTQLQYDRQRLAAYVDEGPINRHRKTAARHSPLEIYGQWEDWQRQVANLFLSDELIERFESVQYDVSMLRREDRQALAIARITSSKTGGRLGDFVDPIAKPAAAESTPAVPILVEEGYRGFNVVNYRGRHIGLSQASGPVDLAEVDDAWLAASRAARQIVVGETLTDAKAQIDLLNATLT